jgi:hypothetical protein
MKRFNLMIVVAIVASIFTACSSDSKEAQQDAFVLNSYVDSVEKLEPVYTVANWTAINDGYQQRIALAETKAEKLSATEKEELEKTKAKYAALKTAYENKLKEKDAEAKAAAATPDYRQVLRNRLFGEGKIGADMKFEFVTADNLLSVYKNFVNTVADNKNSYTREDWDEIKVLYEALDTRKNVVEKDLSSGDNLKIAGLKVRFASIKATKRPGTKGEENEAAKQQ